MQPGGQAPEFAMEQAQKYFELAADQGHPLAQARLARLQENKRSGGSTRAIASVKDAAFIDVTSQTCVDPVWYAALSGDSIALADLILNGIPVIATDGAPHPIELRPLVPEECGPYLQMTCARGHANTAALLLGIRAPVDYTALPNGKSGEMTALMQARKSESRNPLASDSLSSPL